MTYDFAIIGAGIVGLSAAYKIAREKPGSSIIVIEKEEHVAAHQTGRNSGVIHSGIYYKPGSYKAKNCVDGRIQLTEFCKKHDIEYDICGKIIVATDESEMPRLKAIYDRGVENGIEDISLIDADRMKEIEPWVAGVGAIHVPCAGIVNFRSVCEKLQELLLDSGHQIRFNHTVQGVFQADGTVVIETDKGSVKAKQMINCGGLFSDRIARNSGVNSPVKIVPFRGEYYELTEEAGHKVKGLIYPVPDPQFPFLGVHFTRMIEGGVECGPNAVFAFKREGYTKSSFSFDDTIETLNYSGFWKLAAKHWKMGLDEMHRSYSKKAFLKSLQKLIPSVTEDELTEAPAGVRAMALQQNGEILDDFSIIRFDNQLHVINAPSPAATAGLAIGDEICKMAIRD